MLNKNVVTATAMLLTISEEPLPQAHASIRHRSTGRVKRRGRRFSREK